MKKILSLISLCLAAAMILSVCAFAADGDAVLSFRDVGAGEWYYGNVKYVYENGIMKGTSDTEFSPDGTLTRAMCVAILHRAAGEPTVNVKLDFTDVKPGEYYEKPVVWAFARGIVKGRSEKEFVPDGNISRAEFATMLFRYMKASRLTLTETNDSIPSDADKIPEYAADAVNALYRAGIVTGKGGGVFDPDAGITRAETAAMIERFQRSAIDTMENPVFDDGVLDIAFFGDSFTYVPEIPAQLVAIAGRKHRIKTYNCTHGGWMLKEHYEKWSAYSEQTLASKTEKWDAVVLNEIGLLDVLQFKEEYIDEYNALEDWQKEAFESFDDYFDKVTAVTKSDKYYKLIPELFGKDKYYYNLCSSKILKTEEGQEMSDDGLSRYRYDTGPDSEVYRTADPSNKKSLMWKDWLWENCGVERIMINTTGFDPNNPLDPGDFDYMREKGDYHPNLLYGYCFALALYCTIYDEPCIEQNNGLLTDDDIPGDTAEEKEAYMIMIKNMVQEQLDFQNEH